jgi:hypothetical protein
MRSHAASAIYQVQIPVQSPPTNFVAFTAGTADGTDGVVAGDDAVGVSATICGPAPVLSEAPSTNVTAPITASAPVAATIDHIFSDLILGFIWAPCWLLGLIRTLTPDEGEWPIL